MTNPSKILVIGSGGREHALAARLLACPSVTEVVVSPGNAGTTHSAVAGKTLRGAVGEALEVAARGGDGEGRTRPNAHADHAARPRYHECAWIRQNKGV